MVKTRVAWSGLTECGDLLGDCTPWLKAHGALEETAGGDWRRGKVAACRNWQTLGLMTLRQQQLAASAWAPVLICSH